MDRQRKERLVGAAVLIALGVIFIPMILDDSVQPDTGISGTNIPTRPEGEFASRVIPLTPENARASGTDKETAPEAPVSPADHPETVSTAPADTTVAPAPAPAEKEVAPAPAPSTPVNAEAAPEKPAPRPELAAAEPAVSAAGAKAWVVQLGSFSSAENAETLNKKLQQAGYAAFVESSQKDGTKVFKVRVGPELRRSSAEAVRDRLKAKQDIAGIVVPYP